MSEMMKMVDRRFKSLIFKIRLVKLYMFLLYKNYLLNSNIKFKFGKKVKLEKDTKFILGKNSKIEIKNNILIGRESCIECAQNATIIIGENVLLTGYNFIVSMSTINIGNNTIIGEFVSVRDSDHSYRNLNESIRLFKEDNTRPINISNDVWIGRGVTILKGVQIGERSVIGANAVVTKDIPQYSVAVGIPAKVIKKYDFEKRQWVKVCRRG